ncbi:GRB2-associated-binding protein 2 [Cricetulus griseus]|nr:GRB2-associated-binding protein 2 [Cricetulus griseus]
MNGDPDVLEYYKNEHSKKPLQTINLNFCKQLDIGLTFNKKELQKSFMFNIKTNERTFYLVAETEADMNRETHTVVQRREDVSPSAGGALESLRVSGTLFEDVHMCIVLQGEEQGCQVHHYKIGEHAEPKPNGAPGD